MVNAVLRKLPVATNANVSEDSAINIARAAAHPAWMVDRWATFYGLDAARALCHHGQSQPALTLRILDAAAADELHAAGVHLEPGEILNAARAVVSGEVSACAALHDGRVRIQDEGSQLVAELAGAACDTPPRSILDCCAAPGGKTLILAERSPEAKMLACESSLQRFDALRERLAPLGERVECRHADATALPESSAFDLALADVPCSGTGTLGRNPEIRHRLQLEDLPRQAERQRAILLAALRAIRPGGCVVYSTCSMEPEENEEVVAAVLAEMPNARPISLEASIESLDRSGLLIPGAAVRLRASLTTEGALRLLPGAFHTDGFFVALMERTS
jgi:16S rRNA (cytosine967-C5)-methyltransferase